MTEDEAKTKWCPFARSRSIEMGSTVSYHVHGTAKGPTTLCIGSSCMAWRTQTDRVPVGGWQDTDGQSAVTHYEDRPAGGFCGLAGAPQ